MSGLLLTDLVAGYDGVPLSAPLTLAVPRGGIAALLGASGTGKSTLLAAIAGIRPALAGTVLVDDVDVTTLPISARGIGIVFQEPLLFPHLDVAGNIAYGLRRRGVTGTALASRVDELCSWLAIDGLQRRRWDELSGGQAQRVALARALAPRPGVLLLDEPFSALDADLRTRLAADVRALAIAEGVAVLHVTHDEQEAATMADAVVRLLPADGRAMD